MAAAISDALDVDAELIRGDNGIFDVVCDDEMIFSKHEAGRFPDNDEVIERLRPASSR